MLDLHQEMYSALAQGPLLQQTNARLLNCLARHLDAVETAQPTKNLYSLMRNLYAMASAEALYGAENPISRDHSLIQCIWLALT
jgi:hypothetical protein